MNNVKVIYKFTINAPYVNKQPGIVSTLSFGNLTSIRKTEYQPAEKDIFEAAGISLHREILTRISEGRTIHFDGLPTLLKKSDDTFQFEVSGDETILDDGTRERKVIDSAATIFEDIKARLNEEDDNYAVIDFKKVVCRSESCVEETTVVRKGKMKSVLDF